MGSSRTSTSRLRPRHRTPGSRWRIYPSSCIAGSCVPICDVALGDFLEHHFRERYLFTAPDERGGDIVREIARQLAVGSPLQDIFGAEQLTEALDRLTSGWHPAPRALPVHPRVARHFGLRWWTPDMVYKIRGNDLTFRDYTLRYIRWSMWLP